MPQVPWDAILQAACLGKMGRKQEAASCLNNLVLSNPGIQTRLKEYISMFLSSDELIDGLYDGLVRAGLEEIKNPALRRDPQGLL